MSQVESIEKDVEQLDDASFAVFRKWFFDYDNARWDRKIQNDSLAGKLDSLINEGLAEYQAGTTKPL